MVIELNSQRKKKTKQNKCSSSPRPPCQAKENETMWNGRETNLDLGPFLSFSLSKLSSLCTENRKKKDMTKKIICVRFDGNYYRSYLSKE